MKLIVTKSIEIKAKKLGLSFDDIYYFIKENWGKKTSNFEELCSPFDGTTAYKGYLTDLNRIVIFSVNENGLIYPVYIGDKNDKITKSVTVKKIRENANDWLEKIERDINDKKLKIRHF